MIAPYHITLHFARLDPFLSPFCTFLDPFLDYLLQLGTRIIPVEVKSGATGQMRSLHQFMAERGFPLAVRLNTEKPSTAEVDMKTAKGNRAKYKLLNLPFYLTSEIPRLVEGV